MGHVTSCLHDDNLGSARGHEAITDEYLDQHVGHGRNQSTQLALNLQERQREAADTSLMALFGFGGSAASGTVVDPNSSKLIRTDLASLATGGCTEFCSAVCVTMDGLPSPSPRGAPTGYGASPMLQDLEFKNPKADGEVVIQSWSPGALNPPPIFQGVWYDWTAESCSQATLSDEQQERLQLCLKMFIFSMQQGVLCQLRLDESEVGPDAAAQNIDAVVSFSAAVDDLQISVSGSERPVPLRSIRTVRPAERGANERLWFLPSEKDHMVVLKLARSRFVRLRLKTKEQANYFGTCMRLLAKSARGDAAELAKSARSANSTHR